MKGEGHTINSQSSYRSFELNNNLFFVKKRNKDKKYYKERERVRKTSKNKKGHKV